MPRIFTRFLYGIMMVFSLPSLSVLAVESTCTQLDSLASGQALVTEFRYLEDQKAQLTLSQALAASWQTPETNGLSYGYTNSAYWLQLRLCAGDEAATRVLTLSYPVLDNIRVYQRVNEQNWSEVQLGDKLPFVQRLVKHRNFLIPLHLPENSQLDVVLRIESSSSMQLPINIWIEEDFFVHDQNQLILLGVYYGLMFAMVVYNFFVYLSVRERSYVYYVCYAGFMALFLASLQGLTFQYFWPEATSWNDTSIIVFLGLSIFFGLLFTSDFLQLINNFYLNKFLNIIAGILIVIVVFSGVVSYHNNIRILISMAFLCLALAFFVGVARWIQGNVSARYYVVAWTPIITGGLILALNKFNIIPRTLFSENVVQLGSALEVILLSFALADRLNQEKQKRYNVQIQALDHERLARKLQDEALMLEKQARIAQTQALETQKQAKENLEIRVQERTRELEEANKKLEEMSITDGLTGIRNRRYFDQIMQREMARAIRNHESISVLMIDIDHFKKINDGFGHQVGDEVLKALALSLKQTVHRSTDLLARYGGEEFVLVLPNTTEEGALHMAQCIRQVVAELKFPQKDLSVRVSIGVHGGVPSAENNHEEWVRYADEALYMAKSQGRNRVVSYRNKLPV